MTPRVLIIAGSDSGGGAGIQADIKTVTMLGGHAMTAITAITAQNTLGVQAVLAVPSSMVVAQINSIVTDIGVDAVKIGMIGSADTAHAVADVLAGLRVPIVFDPVMVATSGDSLADDATIAGFARLMRLADLVTPNLPELAVLGGEAAVRASTAAVLIKGGHAASETLSDRLIDADGTETRWESPRIDTLHTHGTGCSLASAIATNLALGAALPAAVALARAFVRLAILDAPGLGDGSGPMGQQSVRLDLGPGARLNHITLPTTDYAASCAFYRSLGLKQIVGTDDAHYARFESVGGATLSIDVHAQPTVYLEIESLDVEIARLEHAGITFDDPPADTPWLWREARLKDPSGNAVCLYQAGVARRYPPWRLPNA